MSLEGMWAFQSGQHDAPDSLAAGGVVVLETGRVFGGDQVIAYLGKYQFERGRLEAEVRTFTWNPNQAGQPNIFGVPGPIDMIIMCEGTLGPDGRVIGNVWMRDHPEFKLRAILTKMADLP